MIIIMISIVNLELCKYKVQNMNEEINIALHRGLILYPTDTVYNIFQF